MLASTSKTEDFLDQGGFMNLYVKEEEKWDVFLDQLSNAPKLTKEEKKLLKKNSSSSKREKTMLIGLISVVGISFLFTVVSIFKETLFEPDYVPADEFERKMDLLREQYILENEKLEKELMGIRRELDSLKKQF